KPPCIRTSSQHLPPFSFNYLPPRLFFCTMKPAVDEMFPEGAGPYVDLDEAGGSTGLLMDLAANEKAVHSDFYNGGPAPYTIAEVAWFEDPDAS
ncbi:hypothetical protein NDU88_002998, partial [Pleurodeles waltl]